MVGLELKSMGADLKAGSMGVSLEPEVMGWLGMGAGLRYSSVEVALEAEHVGANL